MFYSHCRLSGVIAEVSATVSSITVGINTLISGYCYLQTSMHKYEADESVLSQGYNHGQIEIGNDNWLGAHVVVFPNAVNEDEPQFQNKPVQSDKVRFGWLGGSSHLHDLMLMNKNITRFLREKKDDTQFVLCGFDIRGNITEFNRETGEQKTRKIKPEEMKNFVGCFLTGTAAEVTPVSCIAENKFKVCEMIIDLNESYQALVKKKKAA